MFVKINKNIRQQGAFRIFTMRPMFSVHCLEKLESEQKRSESITQKDQINCLAKGIAFAGFGNHACPETSKQRLSGNCEVECEIIDCF